jgi:hypothetical protein
MAQTGEDPRNADRDHHHKRQRQHHLAGHFAPVRQRFGDGQRDRPAQGGGDHGVFPDQQDAHPRKPPVMACPCTPRANLDTCLAPDAIVTLIDGDAGGATADDRDGSEDDDDDDCEDEDEPCAANSAGNAAPAGTVAPPTNGLFTSGTAPVVKSN